MKRTFLKKSLAAVFMAGTLLSSLAVPGYADTVNTTPVNGGTTTIQKYLTMDNNANVPVKAFTFSIAPLSAEEVDKANTNNENLSIRPGIPGAVIRDALFTPDQSTKSLASVDAGDTEAAIYVTDEQAASMKYAKSDITVDFSAVEFTEPGVYRYKVTENASNADDGIYELDLNTVRYLDVYVASDEEGVLSVQGYSLHTNNTAPTAKTEDAFDNIDEGYDASDENADYKNQGFTNRYVTHDLTLSKEVTGNQAYRGEYFRFDVVISGDTEGTVYNVDLSSADTSGTINVVDTESGKTYMGTEDFTNPSSLTVGEDGSISAAFYLKHGQNIVIRGLKYGTSYTVTETEKDYTASIALQDGVEDQDIEGNATGNQSIKKADTTVAYTNLRSGAVPTGVFMNYGRSIVMIFASVLILGFAVMHQRKRRFEN